MYSIIVTFDLCPTHLSTCEAHSSLSHAVGTREVELEGIGPCLLTGLAQLRPVLLRIATHQTGYHDLGREGEGGREEEGRERGREGGREGGRERRREGRREVHVG